jgi:hypothetical protein
MEVNNIKGITISEIAGELNLLPITVKMALRKKGIVPIGYVGMVGVYSKTALKVVRERNTRIGRPPKEANSISS